MSERGRRRTGPLPRVDADVGAGRRGRSKGGGRTLRERGALQALEVRAGDDDDDWHHVVDQWAQANGRSNFGLIVCTESSACTETVRVARQFGPQLGVNTVFSAEASLAKTDFTAECVNARNAGVELLELSGDANFVTRVAASCARQQYFPAIVVASSIASPQHFTDPNIGDYIAASPVAPYFLSEIPAVAEFQAAAARYAPGRPLSIGLMTGWVSGKLLERATRTITEPNASQIVDGLHTIAGDTLGGLTGPLTFPAGGNATPFACWWVIQVGEDGNPTAPFGADPTCSDITP